MNDTATKTKGKGKREPKEKHTVYLYEHEDDDIIGAMQSVRETHVISYYIAQALREKLKRDKFITSRNNRLHNTT